jgi:Tol biopolymer transport system component
MRRLSITAALFAATLAPASASAQGSSDVFLVRLNTAGETVAADSVIRVTNRDGYDNQPSFLRDGRTLLYTTIDAAGQADIRRHTMGTRGTSALTVTAPESEYSATQMPAGDRFSVIRVERDSTQRLWSFRLDGTDPRIVLEDVKPVGYHAWVDANRVAVFVLGSPATLQLVDLRGGSPVMIAQDVGRALQPVPGRDAVSFVRRDSADTRWIEIYDVATRTVTRLIRPFAENEYHTWLPNGTLITARGSRLYQFNPSTDTDWVPAADLASQGITNASRLAISADGRWLAVVAAHAAAGQ